MVNSILGASYVALNKIFIYSKIFMKHFLCLMLLKALGLNSSIGRGGKNLSLNSLCVCCGKEIRKWTR